MKNALRTATSDVGMRPFSPGAFGSIPSQHPPCPLPDPATPHLVVSLVPSRHPPWPDPQVSLRPLSIVVYTSGKPRRSAPLARCTPPRLSRFPLPTRRHAERFAWRLFTQRQKGSITVANLTVHRSVLQALALCLCLVLLVAIPLIHGGVPAHHVLVTHGSQQLARVIHSPGNCSSGQTGC